MKGIFITFEGIEGSGKSTQTTLLCTALENHNYKVFCTHEPGGPPIAEEIRDLLLNPRHREMLPETELLLYSASRAQHTGEWILPALKDGKIVVCDRYYDSTFAYQGAARSLDMEFIRILTDFATYHTKPDLTFLLDLSVEEGRKRIQDRHPDRLESENNNFHQCVRNQYLALARECPERFVVLDASLPKETIHNMILTKVLDYIGAQCE
ncbi:MAG TPA: dTMP kinase [Candidatus Syntrophosphaera sp.]|nr:dTMP kinase [Candidatus Syntrophosphaera sp.]